MLEIIDGEKTYCRVITADDNILEKFSPYSKVYKHNNNKNVKLKSYIPNNKVLLNSKYLKIKQNQKLKPNFLDFFESTIK